MKSSYDFGFPVGESAGAGGSAGIFDAALASTGADTAKSTAVIRIKRFTRRTFGEKSVRSAGSRLKRVRKQAARHLLFGRIGFSCVISQP
jgi:hypothetical protein